MRRGSIDKNLVLRLWAEGNTRAMIGRIAARQVGRQMPFTEDAIGRIVRAARAEGDPRAVTRGESSHEER